MKELENGYYYENDNVKIFITKKKIDAKDTKLLKNELTALKFKSDNLKFVTQVHGNDVEIIDEINKICSENEKDAIITNIRKVPLLIYTADCVPLIFFDEESNVVALAHAGWQGTYKKIAVEVLNIMNKKYMCEIKNIKVIIGPHICSQNYEVSEELINKFSTLNIEEYYSKKEEKFFLDLSKINKELIFEQGVSIENITDLNICTVRDNENFYSYRKDNKTSKRIGTIIELK